MFILCFLYVYIISLSYVYTIVTILYITILLVPEFGRVNLGFWVAESWILVPWSRNFARDAKILRPTPEILWADLGILRPTPEYLRPTPKNKGKLAFLWCKILHINKFALKSWQINKIMVFCIGNLPLLLRVLFADWWVLVEWAANDVVTMFRV